MGRYSKNLSGQNQKLFVTPLNVEYTDDTTYTAFVANAVEGEIGVFLDSGAVRTTALTAGLKFFIAQKRDGMINKTPIINWDDNFRKLRTAYDAPVKKVMTIGYNGTSGDIGLDFTGASASNTLTFGISARETTPGNQPFPIQEGYATVNSSTADEYTVLAAIVAQLNGDFDYQRTQPDRFVKAEILANGALTELTQNLTVVNGSTTITAAASITIATGTLVSIRNTIYKVTVGGTGTSFTIDRPYQGVSETIAVGSTVDQAATMAYTSGTTALGVRLTSILEESHFVVAGNYNLTLAPITTITAWKLGAGSGTSIAELEKTEGVIFDGVGGTLNAPFKADYGQPTLFASTSVTYNQIFLDFAPKVLPSAGLPTGYEQKQIQRILLALPSTGNTPDNELTTIFGV